MGVKTYLALHWRACCPFKSTWAQNRKSTYLLRDGQSGKLTVDDYGAKTGRSPGKMRQLNINGPLYIGTWGSLLSQPHPPLPQHHLHTDTYCKWSCLHVNHIIAMKQQSAGSCTGWGWMSSQQSVFVSLKAAWRKSPCTPTGSTAEAWWAACPTSPSPPTTT